jgi:hypothetical protein
MAAFSYIYLHTFVARNAATVGAVLGGALRLAPPQQLELLEHLGNALVGQGVLPARLGDAIGAHVRAVLQAAR